MNPVMKEPSISRFSQLSLRLRLNQLTGARILFPQLLSRFLKPVSGATVILILGGCANVLPGNRPLVTAQQLLALESGPIESGRLLPPVPLPGATTSTPSNQSPVPSNQKILVYVQGDSPDLLAQVRQAVPGAFMRFHNGRRVIQTGLFADGQYAQEQIITLRSRGITGQLATIPEAKQPNLSGRKLLPAGERLDARYSGKRQFIQPGETRDLTLTLMESVLNRAGQVVLPIGSLIKGRVTPVAGGSRFVASSIQVSKAIYPLNAQSALLPNDKTSQQALAGTTATDTAIRAAEAAIEKSSTQIFKRADITPSSTTSSRAIVIESNAVIALQLTSDL